MISNDKMIGLQAEKHVLIESENFNSKEDYILHQMHTYAYVQASQFAHGKKVLDLGCNVGYGSEILSKTAKHVYGVDVSENAILAAKEKYGDLGISFDRVDGENLPFADDEFDMIISCQVIEHVVDYDKYINEIKRVLSSNGLVIFTTPNSLIRLDPGMTPWNEFHVREFDHTELKSLLLKYFSAVGISGLFAEEPIYSLELNRVGKARAKARKRKLFGFITYSPSSIISPLKRVLPNFILTSLRNMQKSTSKSNSLNEDFINENDLNKFYYRLDNMEKVIDLMAVCADDESILHKTLSQIESR